MELLEERARVQQRGHLCSDAFMISHLGDGVRRSFYTYLGAQLQTFLTIRILTV